jgi:Cytochrome P460
MKWLLLLIAACSEPLRDDVTPLAELGYKSWTHKVEVHGDAPGHTGFRTIYANPLAADAMQTLELGYQEGAILVKEVFDDNAGVRGDLRHIAVMRRIGPVTRVLEDDGGWYFTEAKGAGPEEHFDFCFRRCHAAAPYNGAWLDYRD